MRRISILLSATVLVGLLTALPAQAAERGQFQLRCFTSHVAQVDPIVAPGGVSHHEHEFFGNTGTSANPSYDRMLNQTTTCSSPDDTAAYWTPTLYDGNRIVRANNMLVYYRAPFRDDVFLHDMPADLKMVADEFTIGLQNNESLRVAFPSCWDGRLDSQDHRSHMAYPDNGRCPASHLKMIPFITEIFRYGADVRGMRLSSGDFSTGHADFWNTWNQPALDELTATCLRADRRCGRIDGRV